MTSMEELEELIEVERIHASHFAEWERKATYPLAKIVFRLAADNEANHVEWVTELIEIAKSKTNGADLGVDREDLEYWVQDEGREGEIYMESARRAREPWVRAVLYQIGNDETTNAELLKTLRQSPSIRLGELDRFQLWSLLGAVILSS